MPVKENATRALLRKLLGLYDELSSFAGDLTDRIALASRIAGLVSEFELFVEEHQSPDGLEALSHLKESLKAANEGRMPKARGRMREAVRHLARLVAAKRIKAREAELEEKHG